MKNVQKQSFSVLFGRIDMGIEKSDPLDVRRVTGSSPVSSAKKTSFVYPDKRGFLLWLSYDDEICYYKNRGFIITGISELERQQEKSRIFPLFLR